VGKLEQPIVRWTIACLFLAVELLWFVVIPDPGEGDLGSRYVITPADQVMWTVLSFVLFFVLLSALKDFGERDRPLAYATEQVETTQQRRAHFVAGAVDKGAKMIRIETTGPLASWFAAGFLILLAIWVATQSVSGQPVRLICTTSIYVLLAAFAAPPVRGYFTRKLRVTIPRSIVVIILIVGTFLNQAAVAPPLTT
jgi:hypothetical protein